MYLGLTASQEAAQQVFKENTDSVGQLRDLGPYPRERLEKLERGPRIQKGDKKKQTYYIMHLNCKDIDPACSSHWAYRFGCTHLTYEH